MARVELSIDGREIPYKYTTLGLSGRTNFVAAVMMVNHEINKRLGKPREDCSTENFEALLDSLDDILQTLARRVRKAKSEHEKRQKPKGKTPSLIGSTLGRPIKGIAAGKSHCKRCDTSILKDKECWEIPQLGGSFSPCGRYCDDCFRLILEQTKADLDALFGGILMANDNRSQIQIDSSYHCPPERLELLCDAVPVLFRSKQGVIDLFVGAGVPKKFVDGWKLKLKQDKDSVRKHEIARSVLCRLNAAGEPALAPPGGYQAHLGI